MCSLSVVSLLLSSLIFEQLIFKQLIVNILSDTTPSHQQGLTTLRGSRDLIKYAVNTALQKLKEVILNPFDKNVHTYYLQDYLSWNASTCSMT